MISTAQEAHLHISCILNSSKSGLPVPKTQMKTGQLNPKNPKLRV